MASWETDLEKELEKIGESEVRARLARGDYGMVGSSKSRTVNKWLSSKNSERQYARDTRALSVSEEASSIARNAESVAAEAVAQAREASSLSRIASADAHRAIAIAIVAVICSAIAIIGAVIIAF